MGQHIILIGYMGVGKSHIGQILSERSGYPFLDLDQAIEEKDGRSIARIFEEEGESGFRKLERKRLVELLERHTPSVIATGGGTPCFEENLELMQKRGAVMVHLWADPSIILGRIGEKDPDRPKWKGMDEKALREQLEERMSFYQKADLSIDTGNEEAERIAERILEVHWR